MTFSTSAVAVCCCSASVRSSRLGLNFLEQPGVLDRDHRLVGEGLDESICLLMKNGSSALVRERLNNADRPSCSRRSGTA